MGMTIISDRNWNNLLNTPNKAQINTLEVQRELTQFNFSFGLRYTN